MRFYKTTHAFYAGIDLHSRTLYLCVVDADGNKRLHRELKCQVDELELALAPFREGLVVACETTFCWYWLADFCHERDITFVLGHALFMKAIHGGKAKNDRIDAEKIAALLRGGVLPQAYVYPAGMRETRDLLRRRTQLVRQRSTAMVHIQMTNAQWLFPVDIGRPGDRKDSVADDPVRNPFGRPLSVRRPGHLVLPTGEVCSHVRRQKLRHGRSEDRQRSPALGVRRSSRAAHPRIDRSEVLRRPHDKKARQGEGHLDPRREGRSHGLSYAASSSGVRRESFLEHTFKPEKTRRENRMTQRIRSGSDRLAA